MATGLLVPTLLVPSTELVLNNAYGYTTVETLDVRRDLWSANLDLHQNKTKADRRKAPVNSLQVTAGDPLTDASGAVVYTVPTLTQLKAMVATGVTAPDPNNLTGQDAYNILLQLLLQVWMNHPQLPNSSPV